MEYWAGHFGNVSAVGKGSSYYLCQFCHRPFLQLQWLEFAREHTGDFLEFVNSYRLMSCQGGISFLRLAATTLSK